MNTFYQMVRAFNRVRTGIFTGKTPNELIFFVTNKCNFRCQHCFNKTLGLHRDDLTLEEIEKILKSLKGSPVFTVSFSGGEPFLRDDLPQIVYLFTRLCKTYMFMIPTNGFETERILSMVERILRAHSRAAFRVNVSLDGLADAHNSIRRNPGSFDAAVKTIRGLQALKLSNLDSSTVCCTITRDNLNNMIDFQNFMNDSKIEGGYNIVRTNQFNPSPYVNKQTPDDPGIIPDEDKFEEIIKQLFKAKKNKSFFRTVEDRAHLQALIMGNRFLHGKKVEFSCPAGSRIGIIYHNGDVALCENYTSVGNLRDNNYDFISIWQGQEANKQRQAVSKCYCAHPCFINPWLMKKWWRLLLNA